MIPLFALALVGPQIAELDNGRFQVRVRFDDRSVSGHMEAQLVMIEAATAHCKGRGQAISEGTLELNASVPIKKRRTLELRETYACELDKPAPAKKTG